MNKQKVVDQLRAYHRAVDLLMARMIQLDGTFMPSRSKVWPVVEAGSAMIKKLEKEEEKIT